MSEDAATGARMEARAREVAGQLIGTAKSLHEVASDEEMDSMPFNRELDLLAFECSDCGWWAAQEENEDEVCDDCRR
jgi:rubrerythrin